MLIETLVEAVPPRPCDAGLLDDMSGSTRGPRDPGGAVEGVAEQQEREAGEAAHERSDGARARTPTAASGWANRKSIPASPNGYIPGDVAAGALAPAAGVAPAGDWRWRVTFASADPGAERPDGARIATTGRIDGPADFAAAWWPGAPVETRRGGVAALHGPQRTRDVDGVLDDVTAMRACVAATLGSAPAVATVLQAPRERGETALCGVRLPVFWATRGGAMWRRSGTSGSRRGSAASRARSTTSAV
jgi:hypothetical protein